MGSYCSSHGDSASKNLKVQKCQLLSTLHLFKMVPLFHHISIIFSHHLFSDVILLSRAGDFQGKGRAEQIRRPGWACWPLSPSSLATDIRSGRAKHRSIEIKATEMSTEFNRFEQFNDSFNDIFNYIQLCMIICHPMLP